MIARDDRRAMAARIVLATDLPMPRRISFHSNGELLTLSFDRLSEGQAWSAFLGGSTATYPYEGTVYLHEGVIDWHGWSVQLQASEPVEPDTGLDDGTAAQLRELAGGAR